MKTLLSKIPAVVAIAISIFSFILYIDSFVHPETEAWIGSVIIAVFSLPFFFIDAIFSLVRAVKKIDAKFNYILTFVLIGAIPMILIFGGVNKDFFNVIWNVYYLLMVVLEIISIKKVFCTMLANKKKAQ